MKTLLVATGNPGKVREFAQALKADGFEVLDLNELSDKQDFDF